MFVSKCGCVFWKVQQHFPSGPHGFGYCPLMARHIHAAHRCGLGSGNINLTLMLAALRPAFFGVAHTWCDAARPPCCGHRSSLRLWTTGRAHSCRRVDLGADRVQQLHRAPQRSLGAEGRDDEMRKQPFWRSRGNKVSHNAPCDVLSDGRPPKWAAARRLSTPHGEGARQLAFGRS